MSRLKDLRKSNTLNDLASLLGYKPKYLSYILYKIPENEKYSEFTIPKRNGEPRVIHAPTDKLKKLQKRLANLLYDCIDEIKPESEKLKSLTSKNPKRDRAKKSISHGFQQGLSIATNSEPHIRKKYVFNVDIKNFFPSFNFGRVRGYFIKNDKFKLNPKVATIIAQIACHNNELPQGSPCSPVISNLIAQILDIHLVRLAKKHGCTYTRYADDLTFSTNRKVFPKQIAYKGILQKSKWFVGKGLRDCINNSGYEINPKKTHMQFSDSRQVVTGLVVNKVVNVKSDYYRYARSMCHSLFQKGYYSFPDNNNTKKKKPSTVLKLLSSLYNKLIDKDTISNKSNLELTGNDFEDGLSATGSVEQLEGILNHIYQIKNYRNKFANPGYRKSRHDGYLKDKNKNGEHLYPPKNRSNQFAHESHKVSVDGIKNLYSKFLFFKHFHNLQKPLIFCEGKTDNVYLKCALHKLFSDYPELIEKEKNIINYNINFFNRTETVSEMLKLAEGASGMKFIMLGYDRHINRYKCEGKNYPVIMIVDDDDEGRKVVNAANGKHASTKTSLPHHVTENLYLIPLPNHTGSKKTEMEDYFEPSVLNTKLGGKSFKRSNSGINPAKEYGKDYFSKHVIKANQDKINFDAFKPLLDEVVTVIKSHV